MRLSLTWSDPKFADEDVRKDRKSKANLDKAFEQQMAYYFLDQVDDASDADGEGNKQTDDDEEISESDESEEDSTEDDSD